MRAVLLALATASSSIAGCVENGPVMPAVAEIITPCGRVDQLDGQDNDFDGLESWRLDEVRFPRELHHNTTYSWGLTVHNLGNFENYGEVLVLGSITTDSKNYLFVRDDKKLEASAYASRDYGRAEGEQIWAVGEPVTNSLITFTASVKGADGGYDSILARGACFIAG